ncbi:NUDIX domain-containing protein [Candidatus Saccharibacteria bacterium]|nr:NUDIX domain-containing protein [Candidatus Saccharibacteria bacterium]
MLEIIPPSGVAEAISHEREVREFRPTAMILAHTVLDPETGLVSFATIVSAENERRGEPRNLWLPQGGLDDEIPEVAASRELREEIKKGIKPVSPEAFTILGAIRDSSSKPRDGYKAKGKGGKLLIACSAQVENTGALKPNRRENIARASWLEASVLQAILAGNMLANPRKELKARFSIAMIDLVLKNLAK